MSSAQASPSPAGGFDLSQFYQVFFEEAGENLDRLEQALLTIDVQTVDDETLNSVFRCAHSIKGGAATFGFADVAELTHHMETLLDKLRRHELAATPAMVDVLLEGGDALREQLARHQSGAATPAIDTAALVASISQLAQGGAAPATRAKPSPAAAAPAAPAAQAAAVAPATAPGERQLEVLLGPLESEDVVADILTLFSEVGGLGTLTPLDGGQSADGMRRFALTTDSPDEALLDLLSFHVNRDQVQLLSTRAPYGFHVGAPGAPSPEDFDGYGFFDGAPGAPEPGADLPMTAQAAATAGDAVDPASAATRAARAPRAALASENSTLRVSIEKVDQLINLVGELVITQSMLAQATSRLDPSVSALLASGLADLDRNTRDLQESVMSIRMIPMSVVFNRFPRMLRDLAGKLGKQVEFVTHGEATELDKGLVEKITDPLTHLVRNACDHGIESPEQRRAAGKPESGTITLAASHQGGSIVIEVRDDGRGLPREKLMAKARERGIEIADNAPDAEVWNLIFAPGFSTADEVTDVSGRGVGMDVVKRNITSLGGTVEVESTLGRGMRVQVRLPLTLAIMDGMGVSVAGDRYILPIASVVEAFQASADTFRSIGGGGGRVVQIRGEYLPVVALRDVFSLPQADAESAAPVLVVVESEGRRAALVVDELLGQQQVVVKNLESNYRRVSDVAGATILGDGRVALILDVGALTRRSRH